MVTTVIQMTAAGSAVRGDLTVPEGARGVVLFAHGSGSGRLSPRNQQVAEGLRQAGFGTLLMDLLTEDEERIDRRTRELRFNIELLAQRLTTAVDWLGTEPATAKLPVGTFGASTGAAAALRAAAARPDRVVTVVSRGGRPDLAGSALPKVQVPTLLIVGGDDIPVIELNEQAEGRLAICQLAIVQGASHLFSEPGALEEVTRLATDWFQRHLIRPPHATPP